MWGTNWAYAIERWRGANGAEIETWVRAVGELEALLDLGRYAFERPENRFPEMNDEGAVFEAREMASLAARPGFETLRAVREGRVYLTDGNQYFNRPGPRLVESLEILAEMLHPGRFPARSPYRKG